ELMVGRAIVDMYPKEQAPIGKEVFRVENLTCQIANNISFSLRKGEILGLFGLVGSGCVEAVEGIIGKRAIQSGRIYLDGEEVEIRTPIDSKKHGIAYIPSDRKAEGLVLIHSVKNNLTITKIDELGKHGLLKTKKEKAYCETWIKRMGIKTASMNTMVNMLSGGNQQKVVIAKWLLTEPEILIMNDPTRGIDVGAKVEIYKVMESLCKDGVSIIMVSSELPETIGISDRMVILSDGKIVGERKRKDYDQNEILQMAVKGR
ncbi:MAG: ATP-binding cassette domain-containing protein, partial [Spirochaetales bacterium]|nr:ATP-binding cassette domain-containing protein [Spirochaetales bacterium]